MGNKARQYKPSTTRKLDTLSGNQCAAPDCHNTLIAKDNKTVISQICHIQAASHQGPRFNPEMTDDDRRHIDNLILLCGGCHSMIDNKNNESQYTVAVLQEWKKNHESKMLMNLSRNISSLQIAIDRIADADFDDNSIDSEYIMDAFSIDEKITYNAIKRNKPLIEEYRVFYSKINTLYSEMGKQGSFKKTKLLRTIKRIYLKVKGKYVLDADNPMKVIQQNADNIIEDVEEQLLILVESQKTSQDDISFSLSIIMVDAFMRCKILEKVPAL